MIIKKHETVIKMMKEQQDYQYITNLDWYQCVKHIMQR
jgi:hypothetical protein